jgi:cellulose synthase/poly-beta-1,6-N-acetylglucosamine synthase-like glycosyltransferase
MDADTVVRQDILKKTLPHFSSQKIGAVTVSVDIKPTNFLQKVTEIEYALGISLSLGALSKLDSIHVTPGPFTIFRKSMLDKLGGFDVKNMTEDLEIAYRIQKAGYKIGCCLSTKVYTEVPSDFKTLYKQRKRWYTGALHTLFKHKDVVFNSRLGVFGYFIPFTFSLTFLGLFLFIFSNSITLYDQYNNLAFFRLTNFNFFDHIKYFKIDLLNFFTIYAFLLLISFALTLLLAYIGLKILGKSIRKNPLGIIGFLYFFLLYQVFWLASIFSFLFKRKVQWR